MFNNLINSFDWKNIFAGAVISSITALLVWFIKGLYEYYISAKDLPYSIWGYWFSAEYDIKSNVPDTERNYYLKVKIKRRLYRRVIIVALESLDSNPAKVETKWIVRAKIVQGDVLIGTWRSTVKNTNRYGTAIIKFIDYGRATGYWTGYGQYPIYGYWIMSKDFTDLKNISTSVLQDTKFKSIDVSKYVAEYPAPIKIIGK
jgi:hypothetical protein